MANSPDTPELEEWRDVAGMEGAYQVSSLGRVRSLDRTAPNGNGAVRPVPGRILRQYNCRGYWRLNLSHPLRGMIPCYVHRLVCEAFHGPPPEDTEVAHWDGNRSNNAVPNLRWATCTENQLDKRRHGTNLPSIEAKRKLTDAQVRKIRAGTGGSARAMARRFGVSKSTILAVIHRKSWRHLD